MEEFMARIDKTPPTFFFTLPENTAIVLDGDKKEVRCTTPAAAEIISAIVKDKRFQTKGSERRTLLRLSRQIAGRYSGYPIN